MLDLDSPEDFFEAPDFELPDLELPDADLEPVALLPDLDAVDLLSPDLLLSADFDAEDLVPDALLSDDLEADLAVDLLSADFVPVDAFLPAARAAAVVSAADLVFDDGLDAVDLVVLLVVVLLAEALVSAPLSAAVDFDFEEVSLVLLFVVAMVSVV